MVQPRLRLTGDSTLALLAALGHRQPHETFSWWLNGRGVSKRSGLNPVFPCLRSFETCFEPSQVRMGLGAFWFWNLNRQAYPRKVLHFSDEGKQI